MEEALDKMLEVMAQMETIIASLVVAAPLILQWLQRCKSLKAEAKKKHDEGLMALVPWVVRNGHKFFAMYKSWHGYSNSQKKEHLKDLIVAAHRRHNGKSAMSDDDLNKVLHWAESYWKDNKMALKGELNEEQPVVAGVLDALARAEASGGAAPTPAPPSVAEAVGAALSASLAGAGGEAEAPGNA